MGFRKNLRTLYGLIADAEIIRREIKAVNAQRGPIKESLEVSRSYEASRVTRDLSIFKNLVERSRTANYFGPKYPKEVEALVKKFVGEFQSFLPKLEQYQAPPTPRAMSELAKNKNKLKKLHRELDEKKVEIKKLKALMFKKRT